MAANMPSSAVHLHHSAQYPSPSTAFTSTMAGVVNHEDLCASDVRIIQRSVSSSSSNAGDIMDMLDPVADDQSQRPAKIQRDDELSAKISVDGLEEREDPSGWSSEESDAEDDNDSVISDATGVSSDGSDGGEVSDEDFSDDEDEDELNEETILGIKRNDPSIISLAVRRFPSQGASLVDVGQSVGESVHLKKLSVKGESMEWGDGCERLVQFSSGFACNRSLEHFILRECSLDNVGGISTITALSPLFEFNTCLHSIEIKGCDIGDESTLQLASILSRRVNKNSLRCIGLDANKIGDEAASVLIEALSGHTNLVELSLGDNEIARKGSIALGRLLSSPDIKLEKLNLENNQIGDCEVAHLMDPLSNNKSLRELSLSMNCNITQTGWHLFSTCLQSGNSSMEKLDLSSNNFADGGAIALGKALTKNTKLKTLNLFDLNSRGTPLVTGLAWESFFNCLRAPTTALSQIDLRYGSIDERGLDSLVNALTSNSTVKMLDLSHNDQIPAASWLSFFTSLKSSSFAVKELYLQGNNITDNEMPVLANALAKNETLETLMVQPLLPITNAGWAHFRDLLCNKSSIMGISTSNHTLRQLGQLDDQADLETDINSLLLMNKSGNSIEVARKKVIQYHFENGERNIQDLLDLKLNVMPQALSWMSRDDMGGKLLYQVLRSLPSLLVCENRKYNASGMKRKWAPCP